MPIALNLFWFLCLLSFGLPTSLHLLYFCSPCWNGNDDDGVCSWKNVLNDDSNANSDNCDGDGDGDGG